VTGGVRRLVDSGECCEGHAWSVFADVSRDLGAYTTVDLQPTRDVAREVRTRSPSDKCDAAADSLVSFESSTDDAQRANRWAGELEQRRG
jgi:hypothetical protein